MHAAADRHSLIEAAKLSLFFASGKTLLFLRRFALFLPELAGRRRDFRLSFHFPPLRFAPHFCRWPLRLGAIRPIVFHKALRYDW